MVDYGSLEYTQYVLYGMILEARFTSIVSWVFVAVVDFAFVPLFVVVIVSALAYEFYSRVCY